MKASNRPARHLRPCGVLVLLLSSCVSGATASDSISSVALVGLDGQMHRPLGFTWEQPGEGQETRASVLFFITRECPIANAYAPEIQSIIRDHADDPLLFFLIYIDPDITPEAASRHAREYGYDCAALLDPEHELVESIGISVTPEAAVVGREGELLYRGRIDNWYGALGKKRPTPTRRELREGLRALLAGRPVPTARSQAVGCCISDLP